MFSKGDIILPKLKVKSKNGFFNLFHSIVIWDEETDCKVNFQGIILTKIHPSKEYNIEYMDSSYYAFGHISKLDNIYFINRIFHKFPKWSEFELIGKLNTKGLGVIEVYLEDYTPLNFSKYKKILL
ncbi:MAG: hypothetical protein SFU91_04945 [Chloroherpetonaceae bacterium]|nr:hypothetical protein [Chloroherpetonaceae bacterium]